MVVLDTHAWLWWTSEPEKLSTPARQLIDRSEAIGVSAISCFEVARAAERGRLRLDRSAPSWIAQALANPRIKTLPVDADTAIEAAMLDDASFPGDPADRLIFATAQASRGPLISKDRALRRFDPRAVVW